MRKFICGIVLAISLPVFAAVLWPSGPWLETFQNGFLFGNGSIFSALNGVPTFDDKRLDQKKSEIYYIEDFEVTGASDFTCDANLTVTNDTSTPLFDARSLIVAQGATPPTVGAKCTGPNIAVPLGAREGGEKTHLVKIPVINGMNADELAVNIYDVTNGAELAQISLKANTSAKYQPLSFKPSATTANIRLEFEVLVQNASASAEFDNIYFQDALDPLSVYASDSCQAYTPTFGGFGTVTGVDIVYCRDGKWMSIVGVFTTGTPVVSLATIGLPNSLTISSDTSGRFSCGQIHRGAGSSTLQRALCQGGNSSVNVGIFSNSTSEAMNNFQNAGAVFGTGETVHINLRVPIAGWNDKENYVAVKGSTVNDVANTNNFSARVECTATSNITQENLNGWTSSITNNSGGSCTVTFGSGVFSNPPNCTLTSEENGQFYVGGTGSSTSVTVNGVLDGGGNNTSWGGFLKCQKQGSDYVSESDRTTIVPVDSLTGNVFVGRSVSNTTLTTSEPIPYNSNTLGSFDTAGAWDGDEYTVQKNNSKITIKGVASWTTSASRNYGLYVNNVLYKSFGGSDSQSVSHYSFVLGRGETSQGDVLEVRSGGTAGTLSATTTDHNIIINEEYGDRGLFLGNLPIERVEGVATVGAATVAADTPVDITGASISLTAGDWEVCYNSSVFVEWNLNTTGTYCRMNVRDSSNNNIADTESSVYGTLSSSADTFMTVMSQCARIRNTSTTTYKLSITSNTAGTNVECNTLAGDFTGAITGDEGQTKIWANRIR